MKPTTIQVTIVPLTYADHQLRPGPAHIRVDRIISVVPSGNSIDYPDSPPIRSAILLDMGPRVCEVAVQETAELIVARMDGDDFPDEPLYSGQVYSATQEEPGLEVGGEVPEPTGRKVLTFVARKSRGSKRHGLWVFHTDGRGNFFHGDRDEIQDARWTLKSLLSGNFVPVQEVCWQHALKLLGDWEHGVQVLKNIIERERHDAPLPEI